MVFLLNYMLPCAYKSLFGIDCPLCGAQRSFVLLSGGKVADSFLLYPPLVPVLLCAVLFCLHIVNRRLITGKFIRIFALAVLVLVALNYIYKLIAA